MICKHCEQENIKSIKEELALLNKKLDRLLNKND
jgi:hypothetical protein